MRCQGRESPILSTQEYSPHPHPPSCLGVLWFCKCCPHFTSPSTVLSWCPSQPLFFWDRSWKRHPAFAFSLILSWVACRVPCSPEGIGDWRLLSLPGDPAHKTWSICLLKVVLPRPLPTPRVVFQNYGLATSNSSNHGEAVRDTISSKGTGGSFVWRASVHQKRQISVKWGSQGMLCGAHRVWTWTLKVEGILDGSEREWEFENWG